ncbi:interaptin-like [Mytilus californianus]|uniref:interaptin-like n=1 Tax=Mytilus californianus TaxID=6549 RepID=UPI002245C805|nr:interaptin-like [Mytilus californianus]
MNGHADEEVFTGTRTPPDHTPKPSSGINKTSRPTSAKTTTTQIDNVVKTSVTEGPIVLNNETVSRPTSKSKESSRPSSAKYNAADLLPADETDTSKTSDTLNNMNEDQTKDQSDPGKENVTGTTSSSSGPHSRPSSGIEASKVTTAIETNDKIPGDSSPTGKLSPVINESSPVHEANKISRTSSPTDKKISDLNEEFEVEETRKQSSSDKFTTSRPTSGSGSASRPTSASKTIKVINGHSDEEVITGTRTPPGHTSRPSSGINKTSRPTNAKTTTTQIDNDVKTCVTEGPIVLNNETLSRPTSKSKESSRPSSAKDNAADLFPADETDTSKTSDTLNNMNEDQTKDQSDPGKENVTGTTSSSSGPHSRPSSGIEASKVTTAIETNDKIPGDSSPTGKLSPVNNVSSPVHEANKISRTSSPTDTKISDLNEEFEVKETIRQSSSDKIRTSRPTSGSGSASRPTSASKTTTEINGPADEEVFTGTRTPPDHTSRPSSGINKTSRPISAKTTTSKSKESPRPSSASNSAANLMSEDETDTSKTSKQVHVVNKISRTNSPDDTKTSDFKDKFEVKETRRQSSSDNITTSKRTSGSKSASTPKSRSENTKEINGHADEELYTLTETSIDQVSRRPRQVSKTQRPIEENKQMVTEVKDKPEDVETRRRSSSSDNIRTSTGTTIIGNDEIEELNNFTMIEVAGKENATTTTNNKMRAIEDDKNTCISQIEDLREEQGLLRTKIERKQEKIIQLQKDFDEMKLDNKRISEEEQEIKHHVEKLESEILVFTNNLSQVSENTDVVLSQFHELRVHIENESKIHDRQHDNKYSKEFINDTQTLDTGMMEETNNGIHHINKEKVKGEKCHNAQEDVRKYDEQQKSAYQELDNRIKESNELLKNYHEFDKTLHATNHQHLIEIKQTIENIGTHNEKHREPEQNSQENNQSAGEKNTLIYEMKTQFIELKEFIENDMIVKHKQYKDTTNFHESSFAEVKFSSAKNVDDDRNYHDQQRNELRQLRQAVEGSIKIHEAEGENNRKAHDIQLKEFHELKNIVEIRMKDIQSRHTEEEGDDHYVLKYINHIKEHMNVFEQTLKDDRISHECQTQEFRELRQLLENDRRVNKELVEEKEKHNGEWKDEMKAIKTAIESDIKMHEEHSKLFGQYQKSQEQEFHELKKAVVNSQANKVHKDAQPGEHTDRFVNTYSQVDQLKQFLSNNSESQNKQIEDLKVLKQTIEIDMKLREEQRENDRKALNENMNEIKHKLGSILVACDKQHVAPTIEQSNERRDNLDNGNQGEVITYHFNIIKNMIEKDMLLQDNRREAERIHNKKQQMETQKLITILENDRELRAEQRQDFLNLKEKLDSNRKFQENQVEVQESYHNNLKELEKTFERYTSLQVKTSSPDDSKQQGYISNTIPNSMNSHFEDLNQSSERRIILQDEQLRDGNMIQEQLQNTLQKLNGNIGDNIKHLKDMNDRQEILHGIELNEFIEIKQKIDASNKYQETQKQSVQEMIGKMENGNKQLQKTLLVDRNFYEEQRENDRKYYTELRQSETRITGNLYEDYSRSQQELKNVSMELHTETKKCLTGRITAVLDVCQETSEIVKSLDKRPLAAIKQTADSAPVVHDYVERIDNHFYELKHTMDKDRKRQEKQHDEKLKLKSEQREHKKKIKEKHREEDKKSQEELRKQENQLRENQIEEMQILRLTVENDKRIQGKQQEETTRLIKKNNKDILDLKQAIDDERQLRERHRRETRLSKDESKQNDTKWIEKLCDDTYIMKTQFQELNEVFTRDRKLYERQREEDILYRVEQRDHQKTIHEKQREEFQLLKEELAKGRKYQENQREDIAKMRTRFEELKQTIDWDRNFQDKQKDNERKNLDEQRQIDRRLYYQQKEQFQELMKSVENDRKINKENVQEMNGNISQIIKAVKKPKSLSKPEKKSMVAEKEFRVKKRKTTEKVFLQRRKGIEIVVLPKIPSNITSRAREDLHKEKTKKKTTKTTKKKKKKKKLIL